MTTEDLCGKKQSNPLTFRLTDFVTEVMSIEFDETPNYNKLRFLLTRTLLDVDKVPNKQYDWIPASLNDNRDNSYRLNSI